jgi:hypothetical protein
LATDKFALGSNEPLGVNKADSVAAKLEGHDFFSPPPTQGKTASEFPDPSKTTSPVSDSVCGKRKRGIFSEEEILMMPT